MKHEKKKSRARQEVLVAVSMWPTVKLEVRSIYLEVYYASMTLSRGIEKTRDSARAFVFTYVYV